MSIQSDVEVKAKRKALANHAKFVLAKRSTLDGSLPLVIITGVFVFGVKLYFQEAKKK